MTFSEDEVKELSDRIIQIIQERIASHGQHN